MPTILKIGYRAFLLAKETDAARVLTLLAGAVQLDSTYHEHQEVYFPRDDADELTMKAVKPGSVLRYNPKEAHREVDTRVVILNAPKALPASKQKQLGFNA